MSSHGVPVPVPSSSSWLPFFARQPGTHIDEIKEAARKTGDAAKEWTSGSTTPASQEVSPALREVKSARETLETSVSALKETETPVKQRGNGLTGKSG